MGFADHDWVICKNSGNDSHMLLKKYTSLSDAEVCKWHRITEETPASKKPLKYFGRFWNASCL